MNITFSAARLDRPGAQEWEATPELVERRLYADDEHAPTCWLTIVEPGPFTLVEAHGSDHGDRGVFVTAQDRADGATEEAVAEAEAWYRQTHIPDLLGVHGVTGCSWYEAPGGPTIRLYWLDDDPVAFHDDLAAKTPGMSMIDLRPAYRTLIVSAYRTVTGS